MRETQKNLNSAENKIKSQQVKTFKDSIVYEGNSAFAIRILPTVLHSLNLDCVKNNYITSFNGDFRYNFDGLLFYNPIFNAQVFRDGTVEHCEKLYTEPDKEGRKFTYGLSIEFDILKNLKKVVKILNNSNVDSSFIARIFMFNMKNVRLTTGKDHEFGCTTFDRIDRNFLQLPDLMIESVNDDLCTSLKPVLDVFWQASGWSKSPGYTEEGKWNNSAHRS